jgi:cytochrome d ubiquinol oxidase subunit I
MTELGRAPWVVFGLMKIEDAVSPAVPGGSVLISLLGFTLVYAALIVADIYLLNKFAREGVKTSGEIPGQMGEQFPSLAGAD